MSGQEWTSEMVDLLTELWAEGLSASGIAAEMNRHRGIHVTRNSCIGKAHRLGLKARPSPLVVAKYIRPKPARPKLLLLMPNEVRELYRAGTSPELAVLNSEIPRVFAPRSKARRPKSIVEVPMEHTPGYTLEQVKARNGCRFPLGPHREKAVLWCGAEQFEGASYCHFHAKLTRQRATGSLAAAVRLPERVR